MKIKVKNKKRISATISYKASDKLEQISKKLNIPKSTLVEDGVEMIIKKYSE